MPIPDSISSQLIAHSSQQFAAAPPIAPVPPPPVIDAKPVYDPDMAGKVGVLQQMMPPRYGPTLSAYNAANEAAPKPVDVPAPIPVGGIGDISGQPGPSADLPAEFSSRRKDPSGSKPDIAGPGVQVVSSTSPGTTNTPEDQKTAAATAAIMQGNPLGAVMATLPPEAQTVAAVAAPLLSGNLAGSLNALAGKFLPPELLPVWNAFQQMGGLVGPLGIAAPKLPPPFSKPKPPAPGSADLSADPGAACGVAPNAARISDLVACPKGGGPIFTGQMNVLIGYMPAARITDKAVCVGPPDVITDGEQTVKIGNSPASRLADKTAHGGTITSGYGTVLIGKSHAPCAKAAAAKRAAFVINGPAE